jgi:hypothetical protein
VSSVSGHFASSSGGPADRLTFPSLSLNALRTAETRLSTEVQSANTRYEKHDTDYYLSNRIGEEETQKSISVGMRTESDYGTANFMLGELQWQALASKQAGDAVTSWDEPVVRYQGRKDTLPWPGLEAWNGSHYRRVSPAFFDLEEGNPVNRSQPVYTSPAYKEVENTSAKTGYIVIRTV